jgi:hypothetical protein
MDLDLVTKEATAVTLLKRAVEVKMFCKHFFYVVNAPTSYARVILVLSEVNLHKTPHLGKPLQKLLVIDS